MSDKLYLFLGIIVVVLFLIWRRKTIKSQRHVMTSNVYQEVATEKEDLSKIESVNLTFQLKDDSPITADDVEKDTEVTAEQKM